MTFSKRDGALMRELYAPSANDQVAAQARRLGELRRQLAEQERQRDLAERNIRVLSDAIGDLQEE